VEFTLTYQGPLPPRQRSRPVSDAKDALRAAFDPQLREQMAPYEGLSLLPGSGQEPNDTHRFVVGRSMHVGVALSILLLTPPGLGKPGDGDNRVKTLIDGLALPAGPATSGTSDSPLCLLEDDDLVVRYSLDSRPWLGRSPGQTDSLVLVNVKIIIRGVPTEGGMILAM
jgi:hypothetical protein